MKTCCVEGCNAQAAALGACTTHLGLNGGPRAVPVPDNYMYEGDSYRMYRMQEPEAEFAAMVAKAKAPGETFEVPDDVMLFHRPTTPRRHRDRIVARINKSTAWSQLPETYRAWSRGGVVFVTWLLDEETEAGDQ